MLEKLLAWRLAAVKTTVQRRTGARFYKLNI